jgi:inosine-uridine nucleoside N-ribohydrolase
MSGWADALKLRGSLARTVAAVALACAATAVLFGAPASAASAAGAPVPITIDTDIFSSVDDVGALATAFGLQVKGEAKVIAIGINTRTSRSEVQTSQWKCAAAIAQFYNAGDVPIGSSMPDHGTGISTPDWAGPCAQRASASTPEPGTAVNVYRRALVAQPDNSVVMVSTGYLGNLSALLNSPADSISSLSGHDLIAQKVKKLVIMGGGYPSHTTENNLAGDPAAAQNVSANWPTKIVWAGYEVGDAVHTGQTISSVHPTTSPVRIAFEAFIPAGNWYFSYDETAVYEAVRPDDPLLPESSPGTNNIDNAGSNAFATGSGTQTYLLAPDPNGLASKIEELLDTLPAAPTGPTLTASPTSVLPGGVETVSWQGVVAPTSSDWIGLYRSGAGDGSITRWIYTATCTQSTGTAKAAGSCSLNMPSTPGTYEFRLFKQNGYTRLATSAPVTLGNTPAPDGAAPQISSVNAGSISSTGATISWSTDEGATTQVEYGTTLPYSNTTTLDSSLVTTHSQALSGLAPGTSYHYRVKSTDAAGNTTSSVDATFATTASTPGSIQLTASPAGVTPGGSVTATWSGVSSPTRWDWIGVYKSGASDAAIIRWMFDSSCTQSVGSTAKSSGSCSITMPSTAGTYELRLFGNNGFTKLATSNTVTVGAGATDAPTPSPATLSVSSTTIKKGQKLTVSWSGVVGPSTTDWVSLYFQGAPNSQTLWWVYTSNCTQKPARAARASGSCTLTVKNVGTYEIRLFANNGYTQLATSPLITVTR